ncbi:hypothetical protein BH09BAC1_BH09BAC1_24320 [soil metagenome]
MQKLELPQALDDIRAKIKLLEQRLELISEGIELYDALAKDETDAEKNYTYREQASKRREELIVYNEQWRSQQVYLTEFENDLKQQQALRQKQLAHLKEHRQQILDASKARLKKGNLPEQDQVLLKTLREQFIKDQFTTDEERIMRFRELVNTLQRTA